MSLVSPQRADIAQKQEYLKKINPLFYLTCGSVVLGFHSYLGNNAEGRLLHTGYGTTNRMIQHLKYNHCEKRLVQKASASADHKHLNENNPLHLFLAFFFTRVNIRFTQKRLFQLFYSRFFLFQCTGLDWLSLAGA